jgi:YfiR/HmsC-like
MPSATRLAAVKRPAVSQLHRAASRFAFSFHLRHKIGKRASICIAGICILALPLVLLAAVQRGRPTQYDVEAVYLYQFGKFVQWPASSPPNDKFQICVMGRDPFGPILDSTIAGEKIGDSPLQAARIAGIDGAKRCRILYLSPSEEPRVESMLHELGNAPILTVSDLPDFAARGGMIEFVVQDNRVRFDINVAAAKKAGLTISSDLLKVAAAVRGAPSGPNQ